jgi:hypothetical protein
LQVFICVVGEDKSDRSYKICRSSERSQGGIGHSTHNTTEEGYLDWSHIALELSSKSTFEVGEDGDEDLSSCWMILRYREGIRS